MASDLEKENLAVHVELCELRYQSLEGKQNETNNKLDDVHQSVKELKETMEAHITRNNTKALGISQWIIGILITGMGAIVLHLLFKWKLSVNSKTING